MISLEEFFREISAHSTDLLLMTCTETIVFDRAAQVVYVPIVTHKSAKLNPMVDFRTMLGHRLLWSRQIEVDCNSEEMRGVIDAAAFAADEIVSNNQYNIYALN
jgi:hypothetical protein